MDGRRRAGRCRNRPCTSLAPSSASRHAAPPPSCIDQRRRAPVRVGTRSMEWSEARRKRATLSSYRTSKISNVLFRRLRVVSRGRARSRTKAATSPCATGRPRRPRRPRCRVSVKSKGLVVVPLCDSSLLSFLSESKRPVTDRYSLSLVCDTSHEGHVCMYVQRVARVRLCSGITLLGGVSQWNLTLALLPQAKVVRFCHPRCKFCDHVAALVLHCISSQDATVSGSSPDGTAFGSTTVLQVQQLSSSPLCQSPVQRPRRSGTMADVHANVLPCAERLGLSSSAEGSEVAIPFPSVGLVYSVSFSRNG
jgi:hypothetical protein